MTFIRSHSFIWLFSVVVYICYSTIIFAEPGKPEVSKLLDPIEGKAIVYIQYDTENINCGNDGCKHQDGPFVYLDGKEIYKLYTNSYGRFIVEPQVHELEINWGAANLIRPLTHKVKLASGDVKLYRLSFTAPKPYETVVALSTTGSGFSGSQNLEIQLLEVKEPSIINSSLPNLKTQKEIEKIWDSWDQEEEF